jgi:hypothetical protein
VCVCGDGAAPADANLSDSGEHKRAKKNCSYKTNDTETKREVENY